ncbi:MAG: hypothetical protein WAK62_06590, partial [Terriglobales bacterium]
MASAEFSPELCEQLYALPKQVASRINWKRGPGEDVFIFRAKVLAPDGTGFDLTGHWKKNGRHGRTCWGFSLTYMGHCIRSFDMALYHRNPGGAGKVTGSHKHRFSSSKIARFAYKPDPPLSESD